MQKTEVLRGTAPVDGIADFFRQSAENGNFDVNCTSDAVFADWLEEYGDPRHLLVRGDLAIRSLMKRNGADEPEADSWSGASTKFVNQCFGKCTNTLSGSTNIDVDFGTLHFFHEGQYDGKVVLCVIWNDNSVGFGAILTSVELDSLLASLDYPLRYSDLFPANSVSVFPC